MAGVKPTPYFRDVALHQMAEKRHLSNEEMDVLRTGLIEIRRVGNNLNQIVHNANAGMSLNVEETKYQLRELENVVKKFFM